MSKNKNIKKLILLAGVCLIATGCGSKSLTPEEKTFETPTSSAAVTRDNSKTTVPSPTSTTSSNNTTTTLAPATTTNTTTKKLTTTNKPTTTTSSTTTKKTTTTTKKTTTSTTTKKATTSTQAKALTEEEALQKILALKEKYPNGTSWTNENRSYTFKASNKRGYIGYGCAAFAFMASDAAFGTLPVRETKDFDHLRTGDIVRYLNDSHSVIVLENKGDYVVVAEGNINSSVYWGRKVTLSEIKQTGTYVYTRWP